MSNPNTKYFILTGVSVVAAREWDRISADPQTYIGMAILIAIFYLLLRPFFQEPYVPESECRELVPVSNPRPDESLRDHVAFRLGKRLKRVWRGKGGGLVAPGRDKP
jgi:hypothetical protein